MQKDELRPRPIPRFIIRGVDTEGINLNAGVGCVHEKGGGAAFMGAANRQEQPDAVGWEQLLYELF